MSRVVTHTMHWPLADSQSRMVGDMGDQAVNNLSTHVDIATAKILSKVHDAGADAPLAVLRREGIKGTACKDCHEPIAEARLKALPGAVRCCKCEEIHEEQRRLEERGSRRPRC